MPMYRYTMQFVCTYVQKVSKRRKRPEVVFLGRIALRMILVPFVKFWLLCSYLSNLIFLHFLT